MYEPIYKLKQWVKTNWIGLSANPNAINLLEKNPKKIYWNILSANPNAIPLLEKNQDKIFWWMLSVNPSNQF